MLHLYTVKETKNKTKQHFNVPRFRLGAGWHWLRVSASCLGFLMVTYMVDIDEHFAGKSAVCPDFCCVYQMTWYVGSTKQTTQDVMSVTQNYGMFRIGNPELNRLILASWGLDPPDMRQDASATTWKHTTHGSQESKSTPPMSTPLENKALLGAYWGTMMIDNDKPLLRPYFLGVVALIGQP